ncbi:MAG: type II toxin-antitoxin system VapB family antitoxin [Verrucomicrobiota bacterium]
MRITVDLDKSVIDELVIITGEKKMSPAVTKAVIEYLKRQKARQFGRMLREGAFDYPVTNDELEQSS